jgi:hypothetical protein
MPGVTERERNESLLMPFSRRIKADSREIFPPLKAQIPALSPVISLRPARRQSSLKYNSASGLRQVLPVQTKSISMIVYAPVFFVLLTNDIIYTFKCDL